ncbi:hypothetical protein [Marinospirillum sp.]|uniref:hypothetical protein n=1 Tax=Marinospirillum sp. TaxID=2183934 RepID=UPI00384BDE44
MTLSNIAPLQSTQQTTALNPASGTANKANQHSETARQSNDDTAIFSAQGRHYAEQSLESQSTEPKLTYNNKQNNASKADVDSYRKLTDIKSNIDIKSNSYGKPMQEWMYPFFTVPAPLDEKSNEEYKLKISLENEIQGVRDKIKKLHDEAIEKYYGRSDHTQEENEKKIENFIKSKIKNDLEAVQLMNNLGIYI